MTEREGRRRIDEALRRCVDRAGDRARLHPGGVAGWIAAGRARLLEANGWALLPEDPEFPPRLLTLDDPPAMLFGLGRLPDPAVPAVAVVGTRRPTPTGRRFAEEAGRLLASWGVVVVSGLARGVDGRAHAGALDCAELAGHDEPVSIAVLASGVDRCYPPEHRSLYERLIRRGSVVSEYPPGVPPLPHHFVHRNRLLAALSRLVVVVEAGEKSGALITARRAMERGVDVAALPGDIYQPTSAGTNGLIATGSALITGLDGLKHLIDPFVPKAPVLELEEGAPDRPRGLSPDAAALWRSLGPQPRPAEELSRLTALPAGRCWTALLELELAGHCIRHPEGYTRPLAAPVRPSGGR